MKHEPRTYRHVVPPDGLARFNVVVQETDLAVYARELIPEVARELVLDCRGIIERYIQQYPIFAQTLLPWTIQGPTPEIIRQMAEAGTAAGVGPMAAVAGAVADYVGNGLRQKMKEVIVENGGDIFIHVKHPITVGVFAGDSPLSHKLGIRVTCDNHPVALCTSSGRIGHSLSLGDADAVCIMAKSGPLADAVATATANQVHGLKNLGPAVDFAKSVRGVDGVLIIRDDAIAVWGA